MSGTFRLGIFIVATLTILAVGIFLIGDKQFLFSSTYRLNTSFPTVAGLTFGAPVRVGGIDKGVVKDILLPTQPDGRISVLMNMDASTRKVLKKDSLAAIETEGLLGSKFVEISFGSANAEPLKDRDTIDSRPPLDVSDLIRKTNSILDATSEISTKINEGVGTMGSLVNDKSVFQQLNAATSQARAGATAFDENMQALKTNFFLRGFFSRRGYDDSSKLTAHAINELPHQNYSNRFTYDAKRIFDKPDSAKLKNQKALADTGRYLEQNKFGLAVVVVRHEMKGDSDEARILTQARAMVIRDYLVENFKLDDTRLKTMGVGKSDQSDSNSVDILVYGTN